MQLTPQGQRVLGVLIEKQLTTPQQYPLSLNALRTGCNQATNREPVVDYADADVEAGLSDLRDHQLVRTVYGRGSRTAKYEQLLGEALTLTEADLAVLSILLLRGPQTIGEVRSRTERAHRFASIEEVEATLQRLAGHHLGPFVARLERQPGQKEARYEHVLTAPPEPVPPVSDTAPAPPPTAPVPASTPGDQDRLAELTDAVASLQREVDALRADVGDLRRLLRDEGGSDTPL